jgi:hypothetical protein
LKTVSCPKAVDFIMFFFHNVTLRRFNCASANIRDSRILSNTDFQNIDYLGFHPIYVRPMNRNYDDPFTKTAVSKARRQAPP